VVEHVVPKGFGNGDAQIEDLDAPSMDRFGGVLITRSANVDLFHVVVADTRPDYRDLTA
jgi:hypothetical protein